MQKPEWLRLFHIVRLPLRLVKGGGHFFAAGAGFTAASGAVGLFAPLVFSNVPGYNVTKSSGGTVF